MKTPLTLRQVRIALVVIAVLQAVWFGLALQQAAPMPWGDTHDYQFIADELAQGHFGVIWNFYRPPGYPLLIFLSQALGIKSTVAVVVFNRAAAVLAVAVLPGAAGVGIGVGYLLMCSYSTVVSYENFLMSEGPMPGFLLVAWLLGLLAYRAVQKRRYEAATVLLVGQLIWVASLKPAFKAYPVLELGILGMFCAMALPRIARRDVKRVGLNVAALLAFTVLINGVVFRSSGGLPMVQNKAITLVHVLPQLTAGEVALMSPKLQETYGVYHKLLANGPVEMNGVPVPYEDGAQLFDYLIVPHFPTFLGLYVRKMLSLVYYSSWNQNFGNIDMRIGIPRGFGSLGMLLTTCVVGALLALGLGSKVVPDLAALTQVGGCAAYGFAVQMFVAANDDARISMMWVPAYFVFLVQLWWLGWTRARSLARSWPSAARKARKRSSPTGEPTS